MFSPTFVFGGILVDDIEPIHPYVKYGKRDGSPLVDTLHELMNENNIEFHPSSMKFEEFIDSDHMELIETFMHIKRYIRDNAGKCTKSKLFINKYGLRIEPIDE